MRRIILPIVLLTCSPLLAETGPAWKAGAVHVDITPDYPVRLSGYGSRTSEHEKVAQRIHANALALQWQNDAPAVIVTVDNCGVPATVRAEVLKRLAAGGHAVADERFSLHSSHTHCAPMLKGVLPFLFGEDLPPDQAERVERYTEDLTARIVSIVVKALGTVEPARLDWSVGKVYFAFNRRLKTKTGFQNAQNFSGPSDRSLPVLRVKSADGKKLIAIHASYACHCTTLGINEIHGDWAGMAHEEMELRFPGSVCLIAIGCGGDQNPYPRREMRFAVDHGVSIAKEIVRLINRPMQAVNGPLNCVSNEVMLPYDKLPTADEWRAKAADPNKHTAYHAKKHLAMLERGEKIPSALPYSIQIWNYSDDLVTINLPGEVVVDYSLRFKREFDPARTWVNGYTNDVPCYIPSQRVLDEGGYEGGGAMIYYGRPNRFATGVENIIAATVKKLVPQEFATRRVQKLPPPLSGEVRK
ncbi:neutral/alkaline non-lysosomal ceramidase N-terminal domain-containing protein [Prosthecobacter sp.]|uniref:neutral/alkaline non-lysosomal ceramidase N-terminal domain-containing protein n=1 Tax=Prosthecobacter sp. TaxID=1965333 RepID=UPI001DBCFDB9|nr:neutral/alkaline non-lysosomal ceramidase N-terminal domain-containing protein [Prosthecobacter sp.]MCB1277182.1 neutral/alkaline non-lysosomal ceramidase N-terminal domain-containing protein [Prosthecobacter sp.]